MIMEHYGWDMLKALDVLNNSKTFEKSTLLNVDYIIKELYIFSHDYTQEQVSHTKLRNLGLCIKKGIKLNFYFQKHYLYLG